MFGVHINVYPQSSGGSDAHAIFDVSQAVSVFSNCSVESGDSVESQERKEN